MKATAESGKLKFILLKNTLNYVLKAYPRARVFGELIANPAVKTLPFPKSAAKLQRCWVCCVLRMPRGANPTAAEDPWRQQNFSWRDVVLEMSSSYCLGPSSALQLKCVKQINYWDVSGGYHAGKDWLFHGGLCEGFCVNN